MIFAKMDAIGKWQRCFLKALFHAVFALRGRVNFTNLARFSPLCEQTFRRHFEKAFDWIAFNRALSELASSELASPGGDSAPTLIGAIEGYHP